MALLENTVWRNTLQFRKTPSGKIFTNNKRSRDRLEIQATSVTPEGSTMTAPAGLADAYEGRGKHNLSLELPNNVVAAKLKELDDLILESAIRDKWFNLSDAEIQNAYYPLIRMNEQICTLRMKVPKECSVVVAVEFEVNNVRARPGTLQDVLPHVQVIPRFTIGNPWYIPPVDGKVGLLGVSLDCTSLFVNPVGNSDVGAAAFGL